MIKLIECAWAWFRYWLASWIDEWVEYSKDGRCVYRGCLREMPGDLRCDWQALGAELSACLEAAYEGRDAAFKDAKVHSCQSSSHFRPS